LNKNYEEEPDLEDTETEENKTTKKEKDINDKFELIRIFKNNNSCVLIKFLFEFI